MLGKALADLTDDRNVTPRLDLKLDSLVAGGEFGLNVAQENVGVGLNPQRDARGNFMLRSVQQLFERATVCLRFDIPKGIFQASSRHLVSTDRLHEPHRVGGPVHRLPQGHGNDEVIENMPSCIGGFAIVEGLFLSCDLSPACETFRSDFDQQYAAVEGGSEAGLKGRLEIHLQFPNADKLNAHNAPAN